MVRQRKLFDPVCGKRMSRNNEQISIMYKDEIYYLCCPLCQREFE